MRYRNYSYDVADDGIVIKAYLPDADSEETDYLSDTDPMDSGDITQAEDVICLRIPSRIDGLPVVEIGEEAFSENGTLLGRVEIPPTVRKIGKGAFRMCISLTELVLPEGLERIEKEAFFLTPLEELTLPASLQMIENPWEMAAICFHIAPGNPFFFTDGFCLYRREGTRIELLTARQTDERIVYEIPEGTTVIGENALSGNAALRKVILPSSVEVIGEAAFEGCQNLSEVTLREGLCDIRANAFSHCICLKQLRLPASVEMIGRCALSDTFGWSEELRGLERITVADGNVHFTADEDALFEIGDDEDRYLVKYFGRSREYRIPGDVSRILPGAFRRAALRSCLIPSSVKDVGSDAFRECRDLEYLELEESGAVIYVPAQPAYRKDEIVGLFYSRERKNVQEAKADPFFMPEQWKIFACVSPSSVKRERRGDVCEGYVFDYRGYDDLFDTYLNLSDRCGMACCRLIYPVLLDAGSAERYRSFIEENLSDILHGIQKMQDMNRLVQLAELGFFTTENIEESLEVFSRAGQAKFTGFLLNYKKEHLRDSAFDFSF